MSTEKPSLQESEQELHKDAELLESAEEFMRIEEKVEPGYASNTPDFALGEIEVAEEEKKPKPEAPDFDAALRSLEQEAARTRADLAAAEDAPSPL